METTADVIIVGAGIVGLATAFALQEEYPGKTVLVLEKEDRVAFHQSGRNSGVLHSGIYYKPGSLKAATCRKGKRAMEEFCEREGVPYKICGKVIVATTEFERDGLKSLYARGQANGVRCTLVDRTRLLELEPHAAGIEAIHVPETGIVDYKKVCERLASRLFEGGGRVLTHSRLLKLRETATEVTAETTSGDFTSRFLVNCAGVYSDRVAELSGSVAPEKIIPFRGEYFELRPEASQLCQSLIYPVPDPKFPFLGVHFTRRISGAVECGPNAVLALAREAYRKTDVSLSDLVDTLSFSGFRKLALRHWKTGAGEIWRSISKASFVKALQRLVPRITASALLPAPAGIRAQAVAPDGSPVDDFAFNETGRIVNVINAPSPGATASLAIGKMIVEKLARRF
ncbi:MAG TPA: L-2-hydroxyglutarate oxidase [Blastocatellia bacterium]|jgi:L-2-hydroxyglutarate oxidase|nr:L-2-hydroxyglutarate oxidase [Blastocatellia bacterium]